VSQRLHRLERLLAELAAAVDADRGAALFLDAGEGAMELVAESGPRQRGRARLPTLLRRPDQRQPEATVELIVLPDVRSGVVVLERGRAEPFTAEDRAVARLYARQLADGVLVAGLRGGGSIWTRQLEAIQSIAAQLTRLPSVEEVAEAICTETRRVIDYDNVRVYVLAADQRTLEPVAFRSHSREYAGETADGLRLQVGEGITGWVAAHGRPLIVPDAQRDPRVLDVPHTPEVIDESMLLVPMRFESEVIGVIVLSRLGIGRFDEDDLRLVRILSDQAAVAIENARLLAGRDRLVEELAALLDISQAGSMAHEEPMLAQILAGKLVSAARVDACAISRWNEDTGLLHSLGWQGHIDTEGMKPVYDVLEFPLTRMVLLHGAPQVVQRASPDADPAEVALMERYGAETLLMLPLTAGGRTIGLVELYATSGPRDFTEYEMRVYRTMANQAAAVLENARLVEQLRKAADVDQVTGVNNHRYLQERLQQEVARAARTHAPMSVLMVDLDGFKAVNDRHGHADGDRVLRTVAAGLKLAVRTNDVVARYGGDEFMIVMPDTDEAAARVVADRVVQGVRTQRHQLSDGEVVSIACSVGLAVYPEDGRSVGALLKAADAAMYAVKRAGGSAVKRSGPLRASRSAHRVSIEVGSSS
jgi:diguanylate cyclase (GGDEF)-like protein